MQIWLSELPIFLKNHIPSLKDNSNPGIKIIPKKWKYNFFLSISIIHRELQDLA